MKTPHAALELASPMNPQKKFGGLVARRERWGLSRRGWLALLVTAAAAGILWLLNIHPFLAPTQRTETKILVVEGWIHEYALRAAVAEFQNGGYEKIFATGGPIAGSDGATNDYNTSASVGADRLVKLGAAADRVQMAPSHVAGRDRTYSSAVALREWFRTNHVAVTGINVLTEDAHARRTRLLFQEAFGREVRVGIISVANPDYDPARWWRYSEGVREVLGESIAYVYARIFFHPARPAS